MTLPSLPSPHVVLSPAVVVPVGLPHAPPAPYRFQLPRFLVVGAITTVAYLLLFSALHPLVGEQAANAIALLLTADANTAGNRWLTFGFTGRLHVVRHHARSFVAFGVALALSSGALAWLDAGGVSDMRVHIALLLVANVIAGAIHFVLLRSWAFSGG